MDTIALHALAQKLADHWPCVVWAYPAGLPTMFSDTTAQSVTVLQSIGVLDVNLKITDSFKTAVAVAANGRKVEAMAGADFMNIAHAFAGNGGVSTGDETEKNMTLVGILGCALAFLIGLIVREFLPSYFRKKGENLLTKEDIAELKTCRKVSSIGLTRSSRIRSSAMIRASLLSISVLPRIRKRSRCGANFWPKFMAKKSVQLWSDAKHGGRRNVCISNPVFEMRSSGRTRQLARIMDIRSRVST